MKLEPPTRKMGLEETLALTPSLSPSEGERVPEGRERRRFMGRGKHAQFPEFSRPLVLELFHGDSRRLLQGTSIFSTRLSERRTLPRRSICVGPRNPRDGSRRRILRLTPYRVRSARIPKTPHPVPLPIRWGEGGLQVG